MSHRPGKQEVSDRCASMCAMYKRDVPVGEIAATFGVQNPAVWKALRRGGILPAYVPRQPRGARRPAGGGNPGWTEQRREAQAARREELEPPATQYVSRDPCPWCGTRRDYGCSHMAAEVAL